MATKIKPHTITLDRSGARWFVDAALSSASTDDITPVICGARITVTGSNAEILSTNRYQVTRSQAALVESTGDHEFIMPRTALVWLGKNLAAFGNYMSEYQRITITTTEERALSVEVIEGTSIESRSSLVWNGHTVKGNFPPVDRLFEAARKSDPAPATARINLDLIAKVRVLASRHEAPMLKFTFAADSDSKKPGPLLVTFDTNTEVLIQPNLNHR